ncbi:MAG: haloacid dehalogenase type II [Hyphomicrobiales bacterium]|nr:haloacid dehalogenase type II [Hyphomicrobiales bacterium]
MARIKAVAFDAYGTLFDVHAPARRALGLLAPERAAAFSDLWRRKQVEYTWLRSLMGVYEPFDRVTADALDHALDAFALAGEPGLRETLLASYRRLDAQPDAEPALRALTAAGLPIAILSNGASATLKEGCAAAGFNGLIDRILSVEAVGVYKPHPSAYRLALEAFGAAPGEIAFVSANGWDAAGGAQFGLFTLHVNRANAPAERLEAAPHAVIATLKDAPAVILAAA